MTGVQTKLVFLLSATGQGYCYCKAIARDVKLRAADCCKRPLVNILSQIAIKQQKLSLILLESVFFVLRANFKWCMNFIYAALLRKMRDGYA